MSWYDVGIQSRSHMNIMELQYHSLVEFMLSVKPDSIPFPNIAPSLSNATLALAILAVNSSSMCIVLERSLHR